MIYGLYLSATGVLANSHRQDVIANNLANSETVGFKRDTALFQQRLTEAQQRRLPPGHSHPVLEGLSGGMFISPTAIDLSQGDFEQTGRDLDVAIHGRGFFMVMDGDQRRLTRDGRFMIDRTGHLVMAGGEGRRVLDANGRPIVLDPRLRATVDEHGQVTQDGLAFARLALVDVPEPSRLTKLGDNLMSYPEMPAVRPVQPMLRSGFLERANVDPAKELVLLMEAQRQLEANANMIRYQDQMLARLVNDVGRIG
jgi:flagellar basal-body rod protein FlgF